MEILQGNNKFYVGEDENNSIAEITYVNAGEDRLIIDHTHVSDELRGQKVGNKLVEKVVALARAEGKQIVPLCPFAKAQFDRHDEYRDVLAK